MDSDKNGHAAHGTGHPQLHGSASQQSQSQSQSRPQLQLSGSPLQLSSPAPLSLQLLGRPAAPMAVIIVEALSLVTHLPETERGGGTALAYRRLLHGSVASGGTAGEPPTAEDDVLHMFSGTTVHFELLLRVVNEERPVRVFCHEALIYGGAIRDLTVVSAAMGPTDGPDNGEELPKDMRLGEPPSLAGDIAYRVSLPGSLCRPSQSGTRRRLQVFDQDRRLLLSREWEVDVGILNEDAISWLHDTHCWALDSLLLHGEGGAKGRAGEAGAQAEAGQNDKDSENQPETGTDAGANVDPAKCIPSPRPWSVPRADSLSASFVNLDEQAVVLSRSLSCTDSLSTVRSASLLPDGPSVPSSPPGPRDGTPLPAVRTVDIFQQVGYWIYGTRVGQMVSRYDPLEHLKEVYSQAPIWLLGRQYRNDQQPTCPRAIPLGPIRGVREATALGDHRMGPVVWPEGASLLAGPESDTSGQYRLREMLLVPTEDVGTLVASLASWLEAHRWLVSYRCTDSDTSQRHWTLEAQASLGDLHFVMNIGEGEDQVTAGCLVDCQIEGIPGVPAAPDLAMRARTIFVDAIAQLLATAANMASAGRADPRPSAAIFVAMESHECHITLGPYPPYSLTPLTAAAAAAAVPGDGPPPPAASFGLLLWSEHIHDWVRRRATTSARPGPFIDITSYYGTDEGPGDASDPVRASGLLPLLTIDLSPCTVYRFDDGTGRFALSHEGGAWLCFCCPDPDAYEQLINQWLPSILSQNRRSREPSLASATETMPAPRPSPSPAVSVGTLMRRSGADVSPSAAGRNIAATSMAAARASSSASLSSPPRAAPGLEAFLSAWEGCFWFTYRKDFPRLAPSILSSDAGFGCMIRAGQSMIAEALSRLLLGRRSPGEIFTSSSLTTTYKQVSAGSDRENDIPD